MKKSSGKVVRYNKWGYIFLIPFIVVYVIFQLIPLVSTIYNSFFENYRSDQSLSDLQTIKNSFLMEISGFIQKILWYYGSCVSCRRSFYHWYLAPGSPMYVLN